MPKDDVTSSLLFVAHHRMGVETTLIRQFAERHPRAFGTISGCVFLLVGLFATVYGVQTTAEYGAFWDGPRVTGTVFGISESEDERGNREMTLRWYDEEGKRYTGTLWISTPQIGTRVPLVLDRDDHSRAVPEGTIGGMTPLTILGITSVPHTWIGLGLIVFGIGTLIYYRP